MSSLLLGLLQGRGISSKKVSAGNSTRGEEWAGPCPVCGGRDRFRVWPNQEGGPACAKAGVLGTWYCRKEATGGDTMEFCKVVLGMDWRESCRALGMTPDSTGYVYGRLPNMPKQAKSVSFEPKENALPQELWRKQATSLVEKAHTALLGAQKALDYLARRGLDETAVRRYKLGYLSGEKGRQGIFRARSAFGLEAKQGKDGKTKTSLFIPRGITIPAFVSSSDGEANTVRVRIRRPDVDVEKWGDKYMLLEGGCGRTTMLLGNGKEKSPRVIVVVEAELDAMLVHHMAQSLGDDLVGALAVLTNRGRPDAVAHAALKEAATILVALDYDGAGADGWAWWRETYPQAKRWPVPAGKDPGDAYALGEDLRAWILAGVPQGLRPVEPVKAVATPEVAVPQVASSEAVLPEAPQEKTLTRYEQTLLALKTFYEAWRNIPVIFYWLDGGGFEWKFQEKWHIEHLEQDHAFLDMLDAHPALWDHLETHPDKTITARNLFRHCKWIFEDFETLEQKAL